MEMIGYNYKEDIYYIKKKIGKQTAVLEFQHEYDSHDTSYFNVFLSIHTKRKTIDNNLATKKLTGLNPIEDIVAIKRMFEKLLNYFLEHEHYRVALCVRWIDTRRKNVYTRYLAKYGFKMTKFDNSECLMRIYNNEK